MIQFSVFSFQCSVFSVQCSVFSFQFSVFSFQCSVFSVERAATCGSGNEVERSSTFHFFRFSERRSDIASISRAQSLPLVAALATHRNTEKLKQLLDRLARREQWHRSAGIVDEHLFVVDAHVAIHGRQ